MIKRCEFISHMNFDFRIFSCLISWNPQISWFKIGKTQLNGRHWLGWYRIFTCWTYDCPIGSSVFPGHYFANRTFCYRPQRSWGKVIFWQASVILLNRGVSASVHAGIPPPHPLSRHPPGTRPPRTSPPPQEPGTPWEQTPQSRYPPGPGTPQDEQQTPPGTEHAGRYNQRAGGTHHTGMQSC